MSKGLASCAKEVELTESLIFTSYSKNYFGTSIRDVAGSVIAKKLCRGGAWESSIVVVVQYGTVWLMVIIT